MMERLGKSVVNRPVAVIILVLLITAGFIGVFKIKGMESRMDENDFTPDMEEAKADSEISERFTPTYSISIFVRSDDKKSDIIRPEVMVDILTLEDELYNNMEVRKELRSGSMGDITSVSDLLAQVAILQELEVQMSAIGVEMKAAINQSINATIASYVSAGLNETDIEGLRAQVVAYAQPKLDYIKTNATMIALSSYNARRSNITGNLTKVVEGIITEGVDSMQTLILNSSLDTMDNATATSYIEGIVNTTLDGIVSNATETFGYLLGQELAPIVNTTVGYTVGALSACVGEGLGMAYGALIGKKTNELMSAIMGVVENITGQSIDISEMNTTLSGNTTGMDTGAIENAVTYAVMNVSNAMAGIAGAEAMDWTSRVCANTTMALGENLTAYLMGEFGSVNTSGLSHDLYLARNNTTAIQGIFSEYNARIPSGTADVINTTLAVVDSTLVDGELINAEDIITEGTLEVWDYGVGAPLNTTYTYLIANTASAMPTDAMGGMGGMGMGEESTALLELFSTITYQDKIKVFQGGNITLNLGGRNITLSFDAMDADELKNMIRGLYTHPIPQMSFLTEAMNMSFTKEFNPPDSIVAVGVMISLDMNPDLKDHEDRARDMENRITDIVESFESRHEGVVYTTLGTYTVSDEIMEKSNESMAIIMPIALLAVIVILGIVYRSGFDLFISLFGLVLAIVWVYGFGALMGYVFNPLLIAVPVLIIGLGIDFGIHVTMRYREELVEGHSVNKSMVHTIGSVGMALLLATFTTIVAFLSNALSPIPTLSQFGVMCAFGILSSFIIMITFVPAAKVLRDKRRQGLGKPLFPGFPAPAERKKSSKEGVKQEGKKAKNGREDVGVGALDRFLALGAVGSEHHPVAVLAVAFMIMAGGFYSATLLDTKFDFKDFLPEEVPLAKEMRFILDEYEIEDIMGGDVRIYIKGDIATADCIMAMQKSIDNMADDRYVVIKGGQANVKSILSLMEDYATYDVGGNDYRFDPDFADLYFRVFDQNGTLISANASNAEIRALYDWLYTNATLDAKSVLYYDNNTGTYSAAILSVEVDVSDNRNDIYELRDILNKDIKPLKTSSAVESVIITSGPVLTQLILDSMNQSQINSIIITLFVSMIALGIVYYVIERSFILGIITTLPMIFCIAWVFGAMYILGISLNVMTITIASLTVGLGITYGIHVSHRFAEDLKEMGSADRAMRTSVVQVGTALFGAAATTIAGFGLLVFTLLPPVKQFGGITALAILFSFLSSVFVLPSFLILWARRRSTSSGLSDSGTREDDKGGKDVNDGKNTASPQDDKNKAASEATPDKSSDANDTVGGAKDGGTNGV